MTRIGPGQSKPGYRLAQAATLLAAVVVILGAFTRVVDAGLGCPDWPGCYGQLIWPDTPEEIARAEAAFPDAPVDNSKTWPEMVHRYCATLLGMVVIGLVITALRARKAVADYPSSPYPDSPYPDSPYPIKLTIGLLLLVICQGAFGAWTVTLKLWPQVVTAHLLGGFSVLSLLWLLCLRLRGRHWQLPCPDYQALFRYRRWLIVGLAVVLFQIFLGGWTSSNYAAIACTDLPTCQGHWLPPTDFGQAFNFLQGIGPNYLGGTMDNDARVTIHFSHRIGAIVVTLYVLTLCALLLKSAVRTVRPLALTVLAVLTLQVTLGISNVLYIIPLLVAVAHNAGGALLLLTLVTLTFQIYTMQNTEGKPQ